MDAEKKKKIIVWSVVAVIVAVIIYFIFFKKKTEEVVVQDALIAPVSAFPLKMGSKGKEVEQLQIYLLKKYGAQFPISGIDGIWGVETGANVAKFLNKDNVSKDSYDKWNLASIVTSKFK